jgi:hypothetical protein
MAANNYTVNIPPLAPLANPHNANVAQGVAAGNPRNLADVTGAQRETTARKRLKKSDPASVTDNEMAQALVREVAVTAEVSAGVYGGAAAGVAAQLAKLSGQMNAGFAALNAGLAALNAGLAAMNATDRARRRNTNIQNDVPLAQLQKVVAGVGPPLPGGIATAPPNAPVGTPYTTLGAGGLAPIDLNELNQMTLAQISALAEWANEDFEIIAGDNIAVRRNKLREHYTV